MTKNYIQRQEEQVLQQSPDLTTMEPVWDYMRSQRHRDRLNPQENRRKFSKILEVPAEYCEKLPASLLRRIGAVFKARDGHTK